MLKHDEVRSEGWSVKEIKVEFEQWIQSGGGETEGKIEKKGEKGEKRLGEGRRMRRGETSQLFEPNFDWKEISANEKLGFLKKSEI